nr:MAG TPA: hypothetical protein [Caudoviricetes sp.]
MLYVSIKMRLYLLPFGSSLFRFNKIYKKFSR